MTSWVHFFSAHSLKSLERNPSTAFSKSRFPVLSNCHISSLICTKMKYLAVLDRNTTFVCIVAIPEQTSFSSLQRVLKKKKKKLKVEKYLKEQKKLCQILTKVDHSWLFLQIHPRSYNYRQNIRDYVSNHGNSSMIHG